MKILFLGDVVGKSGLSAVLHHLGRLKKKYEADFVIINAENAAMGKGITRPIYDALIQAGADVVTLGNHSFSRKGIISVINECPYLVRPENYDARGIGQSYAIRRCCGKRIAVVSMLGNTYMNAAEDAVTAMHALLPQIRADIIITDLHAEATSDKALFLYYFWDRVTAVIGTHTHVQTADERLYNGCAFISDAGMCGPYESILGSSIRDVMRCTEDGDQVYAEPADGPAILCGVVITVDEDTCRAAGIERIQLRPSVNE